MRRPAAAVLLGLSMLALSACGPDRPAAEGAVVTSASPAPVKTTGSTVGDRTAACGAAKAVRRATAGPVLDAMLALGDSDTPPAQVASAISSAKSGLIQLRSGLTAAVGQTADSTLKSAIGDYASGVGAAIAKLDAAGGDRVKARAAFASFAAAEQKVLNLC